MEFQKDDDYMPHSAIVLQEEPLEEMKDHDSEHCSEEARDQVCHNQFEDATNNAPIPSIQEQLK